MLFIIIGPSGVGKTSITKNLLTQHPDSLTHVVTATTRVPRQGEISGRDYLFLSKKEFSRTPVLAVTEIDGEDYGIPAEGIRCALGKGHNQIIVLDVAGAREIKDAFGEDAKVIFISAGYMALKDRLIKRGDSLNSVGLRLKASVATMRAMIEASLVDAIVPNDEGRLQSATDAVAAIICDFKSGDIIPD